MPQGRFSRTILDEFQQSLSKMQRLISRPRPPVGESLEVDELWKDLGTDRFGPVSNFISTQMEFTQ
jgi:hypothetical protein